MWIGGNWKCNGTITQIKGIVEVLNKAGPFSRNSEVVIAVPSLHLLSTSAIMRNDISVASEDVGLNGMGAWTGETSAEMLKDAGVKWTLAGHSERRAGFGGPGESSETVAGKTAMAIKHGLSVVVCIGETLADRESDRTMDILISQLKPVCERLEKKHWSKIVVAYEPCWAIGTGVVATPVQAEETHSQIRRWLSVNVHEDVANKVRIVYGGSVKGSNCGDLIKCTNIDGFLVGGASLLPDFVNIINSTENVLVSKKRERGE